MTTITATVVELPDTMLCGLCEGEPDAFQCPQCNGSGVMPFPPMPVCGQCDARSLALLGEGDAHGRDETLPVYRCENGHLTAIRYVAKADEKHA